MCGDSAAGVWTLDEQILQWQRISGVHKDNTVPLNRRMCQKRYRANFPAVKIDCITTRIRLTDSAHTVDIVCLTSSLLATPTSFKQIFLFFANVNFLLKQKENSVQWYRIGAWPGSADYSVAPKSIPQRCEACLCVCVSMIVVVVIFFNLQNCFHLFVRVMW